MSLIKLYSLISLFDILRKCVAGVPKMMAHYPPRTHAKSTYPPHAKSIPTLKPNSCLLSPTLSKSTISERITTACRGLHFVFRSPSSAVTAVALQWLYHSPAAPTHKKTTPKKQRTKQPYFFVMLFVSTYKFNCTPSIFLTLCHVLIIFSAHGKIQK